MARPRFSAREIREISDLLTTAPEVMGHVVFQNAEGHWVASTQVLKDGTVIVLDQAMHNRFVMPGGALADSHEDDDSGD